MVYMDIVWFAIFGNPGYPNMTVFSQFQNRRPNDLIRIFYISFYSQKFTEVRLLSCI